MIKTNEELKQSIRVEDDFDLEAVAADVSSLFLTLMDYVENGEPLQARQTFADIKANIEVVEPYIERLPTK